MGVMGGNDYRDQLLALLPSGPAWSRDPASVTGLLARGLADEFARVDVRAADLLEEADPGTATELLPDWERVTGLPDGCIRNPDTLAERRQAVVGRLADRGGQSPSYFASFAKRYGFVVRVEECTSSDCGAATCGSPIAGDEWRFVWIIHIRPATAPESFASFDLGCLIGRAKPAHTYALFYDETGA